jgi:hypothetical protein
MVHINHNKLIDLFNFKAIIYAFAIVNNDYITFCLWSISNGLHWLLYFFKYYADPSKFRFWCFFFEESISL